MICAIYVFTFVIKKERKYVTKFCCDKLLSVPTSFTNNFLLSFTCKLISPDAPIDNGNLYVGSINCILESVPHFIAICSLLFMKYISQ